MKRITRIFHNWSVTSKFVGVYVLILTVSSVITGVILYVQAYSSAISQARSVMEQNLLQTKNSIDEKVDMIENLSQIIAFDSRIQTLLDSAFINESFQLQDYRYNVAPIVDNIMRQNTYIHSIHVYMNNPTIPELFELYDGFYSMNRIKGDMAYVQFMNDSGTQTNWRGLHLEKLLTVRPDVKAKADVFSYNRKIFSGRNDEVNGLVEIEVTQNVLFQPLADANQEVGSVLVLDSSSRVASNNQIQLADERLAELTRVLPEDSGKQNFMATIGGVRSIVISVPLTGPELRLVGVFPVSHFVDKVNQSIRTSFLVIIAALIILSLLVYYLTVKLLSRMKVLLKAMKQVREGSIDVSVPVVWNDEFTQMALSFNHMTTRMHDLVETVYKSELLEKDAELKALESQINPHFLYNTLATISWVARRAKAPDIVKLSDSMAKFYRLVLNKGNSETLVGNELDMVGAYLAIQKFRFEDRFDAVFEVDDRVRHCYTLKNILQPLVENALIHGIEPKRSHGTIIIKASLEDGLVVIRIIDDGVGMSRERALDVTAGKALDSKGSGFAIANIRRRLQAYYGEAQQIELYSRQGIGTVITLSFAARGLSNV
ncbi:sensor histidine kinase [Paenibacillus sp. MMS20-IR301]|uniref:sensor histidine kinase n=1 Tax=Paenibacillus sp. MMS20-IR301 TaxID=2895946 RepID=UPI0028E27969|nr:sensor histidine kinase [Paenibacillus sp. MMS20-IR301]WNS46407.1 sensor histidine kinase [Paenibacillus sp. MMS20-IR301]